MSIQAPYDKSNRGEHKNQSIRRNRDLGHCVTDSKASNDLGITHTLKDRHHGIARNESEAKEHEIVNDEYASRVM